MTVFDFHAKIIECIEVNDRPAKTQTYIEKSCKYAQQTMKENDELECFSMYNKNTSVIPRNHFSQRSRIALMFSSERRKEAPLTKIRSRGQALFEEARHAASVYEEST